MKRILVIEDDIELCDELKIILKDENYLTESANNGLDGLNMIKKNKYDLVLLDLKMPGLNGLEVLKIIKNTYKDLKVIIITARMNIEIEENKLKNEQEKNILKLADKVIQKPFQIKNFLNTINNLIQ